MEILLFTAVGILLYLVCDRLLLVLERMHGEPLPQRNIVFFVLILALTLSTFSLVRTFLFVGESTQNNYEEQQATERGDQPTQPH